MDRRSIIRDFVAHFVGGAQLEDHTDFFSEGFVTSMFAMELVNFVEEKFSIVVRNEDLDFANFNSVDALTRFVDSKTSGDRDGAAAVGAMS